MFKNDIVIISLIIFGCFTSNALAQPKAPIFGEKTIIIHNNNAPQSLHVQYAVTQEALRQGLMHRTNLAPYQGMLFDFKEEKTVIMWMKNTPLALDMLFIKENGSIHHIAYATTPYSTTPISSEGMVRYVLELPAGDTEKHNLSIGNRLDIQ